MAAAGLLVSAAPATAQEEPAGLKLSVTPEEIKAGQAAEISSITPCRDEKDSHLATEVDIEVWFADELVASDTVAAHTPEDPASDGSWSWTYQTTKESGAGVHTVIATCFLLDPEAVPPEPTRRHLGDYYKAEVLLELDTEVHPSNPAVPPAGDSSTAPIGAGYSESHLLVDTLPPPATPVAGRPTFAG